MSELIDLIIEKDIFKGASKDEVTKRREDYAEKLKKSGGKIAYYIDFMSWWIVAKDKDQAEVRALEFLSQGLRPAFTNAEEADEEYQTDPDVIETDQMAGDIEKSEPISIEDRKNMGDYVIDFSCWIIKADSADEAADKAEALMRATIHNGTYPSIANVDFVGTGDRTDRIPVMESGDVFQPASEEEVKKRREDYKKEQLARAEQWVKIAKQELEIALEVETTIVEEDTYAFTLEGIGKSNNGESEWTVYQDSDAAERQALARVKSDLDMEPGMFRQEWLQNYMTISDTDRRILAGEESDNYVDDQLSDDDILEEANMGSEYLDFQDKIDELDTDLSDYDTQVSALEDQREKILEEAKETVRAKKYDEIYDELEDPIEYFVHTHGLYTIEDLAKARFITLDINQAAEDAISEDGVAHFLDHYDGAEVELPSGAVAFGTN